MYFTYVLRSIKDGKLYVGFTENLENRVALHNKGEIESTSNRRPLELIYYEACNNKHDALDRERQLKTGFGRAYLKRRISK
ncbi:MAG: GIY-YIG nuclease family protein [Candidatus Saganbacteria bacterium]|nr:GIY-YIG nuclease family protein [Candidatus Saganbacteria bacterium]